MQEQFFYPRLGADAKEKEHNRFRILNERPIQFSEIFVVKKDEKGEPIKKDDGTFKVTPLRMALCDGRIDISKLQLGKPDDKPKDVDAYLIFNYKEKRLQILSVSQHTIRTALKDLAKEAELSGKFLTDFDITLVKKGDGTKNNTDYVLEVDRLKNKIVFDKLDKQIEEFFLHCKSSGNIHGHHLLSNEYPFDGAAAEPMPKDVKKIFALLKSGKITVDTLRKETDIVVAKMLFRELAKQAAENTDHPGYLIDGDVLMSLDEIKQIRDEIITPF
jgi:hypothetical protein